MLPVVSNYAAYDERQLVERFTSERKYFRRVFSRVDKDARRYPAFVQFASPVIWLK